jgi:glucose-6-phosphate-specific signal transduction histidine kinase
LQRETAEARYKVISFHKYEKMSSTGPDNISTNKQAGLNEVRGLLDSWHDSERLSERMLKDLGRIKDLLGSLESNTEAFARLVLAEEEQRRELAAYLHDGPIQDCVAAILRLQVMARKAAADAPSAIVLDRVQHAFHGLREVENRIYPETLVRSGLIDTVQRIVKGYAREQTRKSDLQIDLGEHDLRMSRAIELTLYRILQHTLDHACNSAATESVTISLLRRESEVHLTVRWKVMPFHKKHVADDRGLTWVRERAAALGGWSELTNSLQGSSFTVGFPLLERTA